MARSRLPSTIRNWQGDSIGHWEGTTLVIDTTNFRGDTRFQGSGERLHIIERFSRAADESLLYRFTADDPDTWTTPWTAELLLRASTVSMFEAACHEGDHDQELLLRGERAAERQGATARP